MNLEGKCRICGVKLTLVVDSTYAALGDLYLLLPKATCNRCYDLREKRKRAIVILERLAARIGELKKADGKGREAIRSKLGFWLKDYASTLAAQLRSDVAFPVDEIVESLMDHPEKISDIMSHFSRAITEEVKSKRKPAELAI